MDSLQRVIDLQKLLLTFNNLERTLLLPSVVGKKDRNETDTEHSYSLAMVAWYLSQNISHLDSNKCIRYALIHDLSELYSGDTFAYDKDATAHATKAARERQGAAKLKQEWPDFPDLAGFLEGYEVREDAESQFVYALDKLMPMVVNLLSEGKSYRLHGVKLDDVKQAKAKKVAASPEINNLYEELITLFESKPEYFC
jgi:putative hydrolase of HD superfamily